ncbi:hypothetical protein [Myroides sp. WP-1]|uniref:hypothetical protein n=1 Tax=Myroides sp. WP-1 TaxID=2759944 RepID=UPI0015F7D48C|nr:hypothetical protein [Myroides sp. WP-1]MBB1138875.1 hypothetical protein [Myroides sp. WP-1]
MKTKLGLVASIFFVVLFFSCKGQEEKPKVIYKDEVKTSEQQEVVKEKTEDIRIADLPLVVGSSPYLIHPVGEVRVYASPSKYGTSKVSQFSYTVSNYVPFEITGYLENLMFQHKDSTDIRPLTTKTIQIQSVVYLNTMAEKIKKNILVYNVFDADTNRDGKIDSNDIKTLYISRGSGKDFKKLSPYLQELLDWTVIEVQNRLYFRTIEDINKNGAFDKNDNVNYFYLDLTDPSWEVKSYDPLKVLSQEAVVEPVDTEETK